jgi:hypothetical protein
MEPLLCAHHFATPMKVGIHAFAGAKQGVDGGPSPATTGWARERCH